MCRYVNTTYTECAHSKTNVFRCDASFDAFPHAPTSKCLAVEETRVRSSHPHCMTCRRMGKGQPRLNPISSLAGRFVSFIDGALGYNTKAKAKAPKTNTYADPNLTSFFHVETADDVKAPTTPSSSSSEEPVDTDSWSTHRHKHVEDYKGIDRGWGSGTRNRESWFSYEDGDESHFSVGPNPFRRNPIPFNPLGVANTNADDRASLPSRRSSPSSTSSLIPQPLALRSSRAAAARDSLRLPGPAIEVPESLRAGGPRPSSWVTGFAGANGGHYDFSNKRHGVIFGELVEFEDSDGESIELDIPSYHGSDEEEEVAGTEINLDIPDYVSSEDEEEAAELDAESNTSTPVELEAPASKPEYDGSLYGDVVTGLPENWEWEDSDTSSIKSRSPTPARDETLFQHPFLRQNWSSGPRAGGAGADVSTARAPAPRAAGKPATHFDHFNFPVGGNEVPTFEGSMLGPISRYWA